MDKTLLLEQDLNKGVELITESLKKAGRKATGETTKSLKVDVSENGTRLRGAILARKFTGLLETGRKPTKGTNVNPSREFVSSIEKWLKAKGLDYSAYAVAKSIHKKGFKGTEGVITDPVNETIQLIKRSFIKQYRKELQINLLNGLNRNKSTN